MPYRAFDKLEWRCPQLGGEVNFGYCREVHEGLPCPRALVCWEHIFPVERYFRLVLREETFDRIFSTPHTDRMDRFLKVVDESVKTVEKNKQGDD